MNKQELDELPEFELTAEQIFSLLDVNPEMSKLYPCPLCGSSQIQLCGDRNNLAKAFARCRECKCTGPLRYWQNRGFPNNVFTMP